MEDSALCPSHSKPPGDQLGLQELDVIQHPSSHHRPSMIPSNFFTWEVVGKIRFHFVRIPLTLFTVVLLGIWTPGTEIDRGVLGSDGHMWRCWPEMTRKIFWDGL